MFQGFLDNVYWFPHKVLLEFGTVIIRPDGSMKASKELKMTIGHTISPSMKTILQFD